MKKISLLTLLGASLFMFSCEDDAPIADGSETPDKFSEWSVEKNKQQLEENGIKLLRGLEGLKDSKSIDAVSHLSSLLETRGEENYEVYPEGRLLKSVSNLRKDPSSATKIFSAMRLKGGLPEERPESPEHFFELYSGTFTYQVNEDSWDFVEGSNTVVFNFPSEEGGTTNNAKLTIRDYQGVSASFDDYAGDFPTNLKMELTVDGAKVMDYSFKATYNNANDLVTLETSLTLDSYIFKLDFSNTTAEVSTNFSLKNGSETLIAAGGSSTGKYKIAAIENSEDGDDIINKASAYVQIYNIKIAGSVDAQSIYKGEKLIYPEGYWQNENFDYDDAKRKEAALYDQFFTMIVYYVDTNKKIAETEFYSETKTDTYQYEVDRNGDGIADGVETYTSTYTSMDLRLVFGDNSRATLDTYFDTGFSEFRAELESFFDAFGE